MNRLFAAFLIALTAVAATAQNVGYRVVWEVVTSADDRPSVQEEVFICGSHMRIARSDNATFLFDRDREQAVLIHTNASHAWRFSFERNRSFFQRFLVPYGIMTEKGVMLFPDTVFRRTGEKTRKNGILCEEVQLPGEFLNSRTRAWYPLEADELESGAMRSYFSFFTRDADFLKQMAELTGFPVEMEMTVRMNDATVVTTRRLTSFESIDCSEVDFSLPDGIRIEDVPGTGLPLMQH